MSLEEEKSSNKMAYRDFVSSQKGGQFLFASVKCRAQFQSPWSSAKHRFNRLGQDPRTISIASAKCRASTARLGSGTKLDEVRMSEDESTPIQQKDEQVSKETKKMVPEFQPPIPYPSDIKEISYMNFERLSTTQLGPFS
ncbi:hypothetical protein DH2020_045532 [Rehmannia glutinosa]|uniref:Uncharacterized protein n=1 Tax=Rehmannia glutinosa TaxID=99300 RepID=A0ABR0UDX8_REHGL